MKIQIAVFLIASILPSVAFATRVSSFCQIEDGEAVGYVCADGAWSGSGSGQITVFSDSGISSSPHTWVTSVVDGCEQVAHEFVDSDSYRCIFSM